MTLPPATKWRKSSYSNGMGGECLEIAEAAPHLAVRDSKVPHGPQLAFSASAWAGFVDAVQAEGAFEGVVPRNR
ncbi:DUF397 domain-containing protein [Streptomyces apocyni]|uniref:DUF397 domain-containing protein n=1 Tax=Streptomyces apocyni TaxID=2654677 RepID=UPI0012EB0352|nr:DUF397 domain-containing protein [Streptomyces apocyni]